MTTNFSDKWGNNLRLSSIDTDNEIEISIPDHTEPDALFYLNEEQARELVRHLNREFDLGLRG